MRSQYNGDAAEARKTARENFIVYFYSTFKLKYEMPAIDLICCATAQ